MATDTLGLGPQHKGLSKFLSGLVLVFCLVLMFGAPLWFGTPEHPELQNTLVEKAVSLVPASASPTDIVASLYVALFQYSYPNRVLHYLLFALGSFTLLLLLSGVNINGNKHNVTYAGIGWALIMLAMFASGRMTKSFNDPWLGAHFMLYGIWFYAVVVVIDSLKRREIAAVVICLSLLAISHVGFLQQAGGLEQTREAYAQEHGSPSFVAYTNAWFLTTHTPTEKYQMNRLLSPRISATFTNPNILAGFVMLALLLSLGLMTGGREKTTRLIAFVTLIVSVLLLLYSRSKSVLVLSAVLACIWVFLYSQARSRSWRKWLPLVMGILVLCGGMLYWGYGNGLSDKLNATGSARLDYYKVAGKMIARKPFGGAGSGAFARWYAMYAPAGAEPTKFAHNALLQLWSEYGLFAAIGWLLALTLPLLNSWDEYQRSVRKDPLQLACILAGVGFWLHCQIDFDFHVPGVVLPALAIMAMALLLPADNDQAQATSATTNLN